jgi:hypothetical protein
MNEEATVVVRLDAKLASVARTGRTAMVCFFVRGASAEDLAALSNAGDADLILGVVYAQAEAAATTSE